MAGRPDFAGQFYREAVAQTVADFPEADPSFDKVGFDKLVAVYQRALDAEQEAYDLRQRLARCEMANLALGQALGVAQASAGTSPGAHRIILLLKSAMNELRLAEVGAPNPDQLDTGPAASMLLEARGHLEVAQSISGPARPSVEVATELIDLALQDVAQLGLHLDLMKRQQGR